MTPDVLKLRLPRADGECGATAQRAWRCSRATGSRKGIAVGEGRQRIDPQGRPPGARPIQGLIIPALPQ
jgi:hypothetical protein